MVNHKLLFISRCNNQENGCAPNRTEEIDRDDVEEPFQGWAQLGSVPIQFSGIPDIDVIDNIVIKSFESERDLQNYSKADFWNSLSLLSESGDESEIIDDYEIIDDTEIIDEPEIIDAVEIIADSEIVGGSNLGDSQHTMAPNALTDELTHQHLLLHTIKLEESTDSSQKRSSNSQIAQHNWLAHGRIDVSHTPSDGSEYMDKKRLCIPNRKFDSRSAFFSNMLDDFLAESCDFKISPEEPEKMQSTLTCYTNLEFTKTISNPGNIFEECNPPNSELSFGAIKHCKEPCARPRRHNTALKQDKNDSKFVVANESLSQRSGAKSKKNVYPCYYPSSLPVKLVFPNNKSKTAPDSVTQVCMVLNIGHGRTLYQEAHNNLELLRKDSCYIDKRIAHFAASAVKESPLKATQITRMLVPVVCPFLNKLMQNTEQKRIKQIKRRVTCLSLEKNRFKIDNKIKCPVTIEENFHREIFNVVHDMLESVCVSYDNNGRTIVPCLTLKNTNQSNKSVNSSEIPIETKQTLFDINCEKEYCRLGCICSSLKIGRHRSGHCKQFKCMIKCSCIGNILHNHNETEKYSNSLLSYMADRVESEEKEVSVGKKHERRNIKLPQRYRSDDVLLGCDFKISEICDARAYHKGKDNLGKNGTRNNLSKEISEFCPRKPNKKNQQFEIHHQDSSTNDKQLLDQYCIKPCFVVVQRLYGGNIGHYEPSKQSSSHLNFTNTDGEQFSYSQNNVAAAILPQALRFPIKEELVENIDSDDCVSVESLYSNTCSDTGGTAVNDQSMCSDPYTSTGRIAAGDQSMCSNPCTIIGGVAACDHNLYSNPCIDTVGVAVNNQNLYRKPFTDTACSAVIDHDYDRIEPCIGSVTNTTNSLSPEELVRLSKKQKINKWFVIKMERSFDFLMLPPNYIHLLNYDGLFKTIAFAHNSKSTYRFYPNHNINRTNKFGVYAFPDNQEELFIGPFSKNDHHYVIALSKMSNNFVQVPFNLTAKNCPGTVSARWIITTNESESRNEEMLNKSSLHNKMSKSNSQLSKKITTSESENRNEEMLNKSAIHNLILKSNSELSNKILTSESENRNEEMLKKSALHNLILKSNSQPLNKVTSESENKNEEMLNRSAIHNLKSKSSQLHNKITTSESENSNEEMLNRSALRNLMLKSNSQHNNIEHSYSEFFSTDFIPCKEQRQLPSDLIGKDSAVNENEPARKKIRTLLPIQRRDEVPSVGKGSTKLKQAKNMNEEGKKSTFISHSHRNESPILTDNTYKMHQRNNMIEIHGQNENTSSIVIHPETQLPKSLLKKSTDNDFSLQLRIDYLQKKQNSRSQCFQDKPGEPHDSDKKVYCLDVMTTSCSFASPLHFDGSNVNTPERKRNGINPSPDSSVLTKYVLLCETPNIGYVPILDYKPNRVLIPDPIKHNKIHQFSKVVYAAHFLNCTLKQNVQFIPEDMEPSWIAVRRKWVEKLTPISLTRITQYHFLSAEGLSKLKEEKIHNSKEMRRRKELKALMYDLARLLNFHQRCRKLDVLKMAIDEIRKLETTSKEMEMGMEDIRKKLLRNFEKIRTQYLDGLPKETRHILQKCCNQVNEKLRAQSQSLPTRNIQPPKKDKKTKAKNVTQCVAPNISTAVVRPDKCVKSAAKSSVLKRRHPKEPTVGSEVTVSSDSSAVKKLVEVENCSNTEKREQPVEQSKESTPPGPFKLLRLSPGQMNELLMNKGQVVKLPKGAPRQLQLQVAKDMQKQHFSKIVKQFPLPSCEGTQNDVVTPIFSDCESQIGVTTAPNSYETDKEITIAPTANKSSLSLLLTGSPISSSSSLPQCVDSDIHKKLKPILPKVCPTALMKSKFTFVRTEIPFTVSQCQPSVLTKPLDTISSVSFLSPNVATNSSTQSDSVESLSISIHDKTTERPVLREPISLHSDKCHVDIQCKINGIDVPEVELNSLEGPSSLQPLSKELASTTSQFSYENLITPSSKLNSLGGPVSLPPLSEELASMTSQSSYGNLITPSIKLNSLGGPISLQTLSKELASTTSQSSYGNLIAPSSKLNSLGGPISLQTLSKELASTTSQSSYGNLIAPSSKLNSLGGPSSLQPLSKELVSTTSHSSYGNLIAPSSKLNSLGGPVSLQPLSKELASMTSQSSYENLMTPLRKLNSLRGSSSLQPLCKKLASTTLQSSYESLVTPSWKSNALEGPSSLQPLSKELASTASQSSYKIFIPASSKLNSLEGPCSLQPLSKELASNTSQSSYENLTVPLIKVNSLEGLSSLQPLSKDLASTTSETICLEPIIQSSSSVCEKSHKPNYFGSSRSLPTVSQSALQHSGNNSVETTRLFQSNSVRPQNVPNQCMKEIRPLMPGSSENNSQKSKDKSNLGRIWTPKGLLQVLHIVDDNGDDIKSAGELPLVVQKKIVDTAEVISLDSRDDQDSEDDIQELEVPPKIITIDDDDDEEDQLSDSDSDVVLIV